MTLYYDKEYIKVGGINKSINNNFFSGICEEKGMSHLCLEDINSKSKHVSKMWDSWGLRKMLNCVAYNLLYSEVLCSSLSG